MCHRVCDLDTAVWSLYSTIVTLRKLDFCQNFAGFIGFARCALVRSLPISLQSLSEVLRHALAVFVTESEPVLGGGVTLVRSEAIPLYRLSVVLRYALS